MITSKNNTLKSSLIQKDGKAIPLITSKSNHAASNPQTLLIRFNTPLTHSEISLFRDAVCDALTKKNDLFFNREVDDEGHGGKEIYRYSKIHYRVLDGKAAIFGINEGAKALRGFLLKDAKHLQWKGRIMYADFERESEKKLLFTKAAAMSCYHIHGYYALNGIKNKEWNNLPDAKAQIAFLEDRLRSHLHGFVKEMGWEPKRRIKVKLIDYIGRKLATYKNKPVKVFELRYRCNLELPDHIALGRVVSHGFGWQVQESKAQK